ncbi:SUMF1/EgtB/PvdO family nonheme iron enzyme [Duganella sp. Leaf126]|uniref:formylglycine-generating enzyme family protein n=1 Tax=Duganella sp. Leaf126 TaxID=1736266 RepID=UPI0009EA21C0|nr:SUMF1/EgtB/PvdO family nonheme iron enzyme [Duganella sp. Leaf126]
MKIKKFVLGSLLVYSNILMAKQPEKIDGQANVETLADGNVRDGVPDAKTLKSLVERTKKNMIPLSSGTFQMGDWGALVNAGQLPYDGSPDSKPLHDVSLTGFAMSKFPVTYAEFDLFVAAMGLPRVNQSTFYLRFRKSNNPVGVSWQGAKDYCQWIGKLSGLPVDLPTEAQWEYAARSKGKRYLYPTDDGTRDDGRNVPSYEQKKAAGGLVEVGKFPPNPAGFHDFGAGTHEWTNDWYAADYYEKSPRDNPKGPNEGPGKVVRGDFGNIQMTFQRWYRPVEEETGTWTLRSTTRGGPKREIPYTKYSATSENAFRCVVNQSGPIR